MNGIHVFLGPSLGLDDARAVLDATYHPPVRMGDIATLLRREKPRAICIIDGYFERVPAVWHKEILFALSRGVHVIGASSMGALRGAELHTFGMVGVGAIFEAFKTGAIHADDEVTLIHGSAEDGYRGLSEPLVNIRLGLARAASMGIIEHRVHDELLAVARKIFYPQRSWGSLYVAAKDLGVPVEQVSRLKEFVRTERPNAKRDDALLALEATARLAASPPCLVDFDFEETDFWNQLLATTSDVVVGSSRVEERAVLDYARLLGKGKREALLLVLVQREADRLGVRLTPDEERRALEGFRRDRGLLSGESLRTWLLDNAMTSDDLAALVRLEALADILVGYHRRTVETAVSTEFKRTSEFAKFAREVDAIHSFLEARGTPQPTLEDVNITVDALLAWHRQKTGASVHGRSLDVQAKVAGFQASADFVRELLKLYVYETARVPVDAAAE